MMYSSSEMSTSDKVKLLINHYGYTDDDLSDMDDEYLDSLVQEKIDEFDDSNLKAEIEQSGLMEIDDDMTLLDILTEWDDIHDESDMYPNGRDYDSENFD